MAKPKPVRIVGRSTSAKQMAKKFKIPKAKQEEIARLVSDLFQKKPGAMDRKVANREIMKRLAKAVELNPEVRFGQLLSNLGLVKEFRFLDDNTAWFNEFNTESEATLKRMIAEAK